MTHSGKIYIVLELLNYVLIPLLLDDPLWAETYIVHSILPELVLIPLLLDDPLWATKITVLRMKSLGLNPSFAG